MAASQPLPTLKIADTVLSLPKQWLVVASIVLIAVIGWLDYITEFGLSFFVFYGIPVFVIGWLRLRTTAITIALASGLTWYLANLPTQPYATQQAYIWASVNRAAYFVFVAVGGAAIRAQREESRAKIEALTRARELEREIVRVSEREQMRIGQDLHDGLCQNLVAIDCAAACLKADLEAQSSPGAGMASVIQKMLRDCVIEARKVARGIFPVQVDAAGLSAALHELVATTNQLRQTSIILETHGEIRIESPEVAMHLYRIAQEALSNALRHAGAGSVTIDLSQHDSRLTITVADDGRGFVSREQAPTGMGLNTMRYRAQQIGADLEIVSDSAGGTVVRCALDLSKAPRGHIAVRAEDGPVGAVV